jgi:hypothetical protein
MGYVYWEGRGELCLPRGVNFLPYLLADASAVKVRDILSSTLNNVYRTRDGWIWHDYELLITDSKPSPDPDGVWRYEYKGERYPLLARRVEWKVLELESLFG